MSLFANVIFLSFASFFFGSFLCLATYAFKHYQDYRENSIVVEHYKKIKEIDSIYVKREIDLTESKNQNTINHIKFFDFNYLQFLSHYKSNNSELPESKFSMFVQNYISICLTTLYFVSIIMLTYYSSTFTEDTLTFFIKSEFLNYLITLVSTIASFNLAKSFLFSFKR